jgi:DNA-3-methyladenine glycosylase I
MSRCCWVNDDPLMIAYHDTEWGTPSHDDRHLYEMLVLEGAQAGLSWQTILRKRARYQGVFDGFDPARVARFTPARIEKLLADPGIVRNRAKVEAAVINARKVLEVQDEVGSLDAFLWGFVGGKPVVNRWESTRLQVRRPDHLLRLHAGDRDGGRPRSRLLPGRQIEEGEITGA